jgi:hypothetical protein
VVFGYVGGILDLAALLPAGFFLVQQFPIFYYSIYRAICTFNLNGIIGNFAYIINL